MRFESQISGILSQPCRSARRRNLKTLRPPGCALPGAGRTLSPGHDRPCRPASRACRLCADRFAATATAHAPRPVAWFSPGAHVRIVGQAPGMRVHESGLPFNDASGDRLRDWMGIDRDDLLRPRPGSRSPRWPSAFPATTRAAPTCRRRSSAPHTWGDAVDAALPDVRLTLLVGAHAQRRHLAHPRRAHRHRARLARPCAHDLSLASPVLAQYGLAQEKPVVRDRAAAGAAGPGERRTWEDNRWP